MQENNYNSIFLSIFKKIAKTHNTYSETFQHNGKEVLVIPDMLSEGEFLTLSHEKIIVDREEKEAILLRHFYKGLEDKNLIYEKAMLLSLTEEFFLEEDIHGMISIYIKSQLEQLSYSLENSMASRATILKAISKIKRSEIMELEEELNQYNDSIADTLIEEVKRKGFDIETPIMLKDNHYSINIQKDKKYFINKMEVVFDREDDNRLGFRNLLPYVHFEVGRIQPDGFNYNRNIISNDNWKKHNADFIFDKIRLTTKNKFSEKEENIHTNITTYFLNKPEDFPELDNGIIYKIKPLTYADMFFTNSLRGIIRDLKQKFQDLDKIVKIEDCFYYFSINGTKYAYFGLDLEKNFSITNSNIKNIIKLAKNNSEFLIKLEEDFDIYDRRKWGDKAETKEFLIKEFSKQIEALIKKEQKNDIK